MKSPYVVYVLVALLGTCVPWKQVRSQDSIVPRVDPRMETIAVVARLAKFDEFDQPAGEYSRAVDEWFKPFTEHPAVLFLRQKRVDSGVGFDAIPNLGLHLPASFKADDEGTIKAWVKSIDKRWERKDAVRMAGLLQDFYVEAKCESFFETHKELYRLSSERLQQVLNDVEMTWYEKFFGEKPKGRFNLLVGMLNGNGNYSVNVVSRNGEEELYAIIGNDRRDREGLPTFDSQNLTLIIHEYGHCFSNPLIRENLDALRSCGEALYPRVSDKMRYQGYGAWEAMFYETMVRACVIRYAKSHPSEAISATTILENEEANGFVWMGALVELLDRYENNRKQYPNLRSFMPEVVKFLQSLPSRFDLLQARWEAAATELFGYKVKEKTVTFLFERPADTPPQFKIESVTVAGVFNSWNPKDKAFQMTTKDHRKFELQMPTDQLGKPGEKPQFKFVVNESTWVTPPHKASNKVRDPDGNVNLFLEIPK